MRFPLWLHIDCGCHVADMAHMFMCLIDKHAESQGVIKNNASSINTRIGQGFLFASCSLGRGGAECYCGSSNRSPERRARLAPEAAGEWPT